MPMPTTSLVSASVLVLLFAGASIGCDAQTDKAKADKASKGDASAKPAEDTKVTVDPNGNVQVQGRNGNGVSLDGAQ